MNNEQFRRLVGSSTPKPAPISEGSTPVPRALSLGSRQTSSIPMTPYVLPGRIYGQETEYSCRRSVGFGKSDFQRQLAERNQTNKQPKKFKSSVPKGSKLAAGYTDRAKAREVEEEDERAVRLQALEESLKKEEIDQATFDQLRAQIAGGDLSSTHLVKGLDFKLLERVRRGEDVFDENRAKQEDDEPEDVDEAFNELESAKIEAIEREKTVKKGHLASGGLKPGQKRTRDMILAEMKAAREAGKAKQAESALGTKFKKIGDKAVPGSSRIEIDGQGREVLIVVDEDGHEKRKVRKIQPQAQAKAEPSSEAKTREMMMPDKDAKPLGMEIPDAYKARLQKPEEDDGDIFDGVGDDYDPLAGLGDDSDEEEDEPKRPTKVEDEAAGTADGAAKPPLPRPAAASAPRNYFKDAKTGLVSAETLKAPSLSDPMIAAALKKAATLKAVAMEAEEDDEKAKAKAERHRKMLQNVDRDAEDMDMGFGTSRFEDEADLDDSKVKLSEWGAEGDDDQGHQGGGKAKRKRGGKKRKGDANSVADVMRVMEQRKAAG